MARRSDHGSNLELRGRELEIMNIVLRGGEVTVEDVRGGLDKSVSGSAVRTVLSRLEAKGRVRSERRGQRNHYRPVTPPAAVSASAVDRFVMSFFRGSGIQAALALLDSQSMRKTVNREELTRLRSLLEELRAEEEEEEEDRS